MRSIEGRKGCWDRFGRGPPFTSGVAVLYDIRELSHTPAQCRRHKTIGPQLRGPIKGIATSFSASESCCAGRKPPDGVAFAPAADGCLTARLLESAQSVSVDRVADARLQELVAEAENLETAAITNDPEIQLGSFAVGRRYLDEARQTRLLFHGSIDPWAPANRSR